MATDFKRQVEWLLVSGVSDLTGDRPAASACGSCALNLRGKNALLDARFYDLFLGDSPKATRSSVATSLVFSTEKTVWDVAACA